MDLLWACVARCTSGSERIEIINHKLTLWLLHSGVQPLYSDRAVLLSEMPLRLSKHCIQACIASLLHNAYVMCFSEVCWTFAVRARPLGYKRRATWLPSNAYLYRPPHNLEHTLQLIISYIISS